jgi:hypothetical protein
MSDRSCANVMISSPIPAYFQLTPIFPAHISNITNTSPMISLKFASGICSESACEPWIPYDATMCASPTIPRVYGAKSDTKSPLHIVLSRSYHIVSHRYLAGKGDESSGTLRSIARVETGNIWLRGRFKWHSSRSHTCHRYYNCPIAIIKINAKVECASHVLHPWGTQHDLVTFS